MSARDGVLWCDDPGCDDAGPHDPNSTMTTAKEARRHARRDGWTYGRDKLDRCADHSRRKAVSRA